MHTEPGLAEAAELFKVLGNASRLTILRIIGDQSRTVGALAASTGMSQPLVSQHLRTLRQAGLVTATRSGKEICYRLADLHVAHVVADAITHAQEPVLREDTTDQSAPDRASRPEGQNMTSDIHAEHTTAEHEHGDTCGHEAVPHEDHVDYVHGTHHHALHGDHYDEHEAVAEHTASEHAHGDDCGHEAVAHDDHVDYVHDGHKHAAHGDHYDEH